MKRLFYVSVIFSLILTSQSVYSQQFTQTLPKGTIHGVHVKYNTGTYITVTTGYGECGGNYFEVAEEITYEMTGLTTSEDYHYIYICDNDSAYPAIDITDTTTEPAWNDSKQGWYNGADRCIGVVWSASGSATVHPFGMDGTGRYFITGNVIKTVLTNGNPNGAFQTLEATDYSPVNTIELFVGADNTDSDGTQTAAQVTPYECTWAQISENGYRGASAFGWLKIQRGWSRDLKWYGPDDDDNGFRISICGYKIER